MPWTRSNFRMPWWPAARYSCWSMPIIQLLGYFITPCRRWTRGASAQYHRQPGLPAPGLDSRGLARCAGSMVTAAECQWIWLEVRESNARARECLPRARLLPKSACARNYYPTPTAARTYGAHGVSKLVSEPGCPPAECAGAMGITRLAADPDGTSSNCCCRCSSPPPSPVAGVRRGTGACAATPPAP